MDQQNQSTDSPLFGLSIDQAIRSHLSETARWGKFLAIVGFILCALIVIGGIVFATVFSSLDRYGSTYETRSAFSSLGPSIAVLYIFIAVIYFFPCLFLLRFANKMKTALAANSQEDLTVSFQNLKVMYRYVGIIMIIILSIYALAIVFGGLGALMR